MSTAVPDWDALDASFTCTLDAALPADPPDPFSLSVDELVQCGAEASIPQDDQALDALDARTVSRSGGRLRRALRRLTRRDAADSAVAHQIAELRLPLDGPRRIAVVSTKGGVGKTSTTVNLGHTLATFRGDRVIALDANPDAGSLGHRVARESELTSHDVLQADSIPSYTAMRTFTSQAPSRLEVLASPEDPRRSRTMGREAHLRLLDRLEQHYNLILADCGTGILDAATRGIVQGSDQLVVVTAPSVDSARAVTHLLRWLAAHDMEAAVQQAVVVINGVRPGCPLDVPALRAHFAGIVEQVHVVPFDDELAAGGTTCLDTYDAATRDAYLSLAMGVVQILRTTGPRQERDT